MQTIRKFLPASAVKRDCPTCGRPISTNGFAWASHQRSHKSVGENASPYPAPPANDPLPEPTPISVYQAIADTVKTRWKNSNASVEYPGCVHISPSHGFGTCYVLGDVNETWGADVYTDTDALESGDPEGSIDLEIPSHNHDADVILKAFLVGVQTFENRHLQGIADAINAQLPTAEAHVGNSGGDVMCVYATLPDGRGLLIGDTATEWAGSTFEDGGDGDLIDDLNTVIPVESTDYTAIASALLAEAK